MGAVALSSVFRHRRSFVIRFRGWERACQAGSSRSMPSLTQEGKGHGASEAGKAISSKLREERSLQSSGRDSNIPSGARPSLGERVISKYPIDERH